MHSNRRSKEGTSQVCVPKRQRTVKGPCALLSIVLNVHMVVHFPSRGHGLFRPKQQTIPASKKFSLTARCLHSHKSSEQCRSVVIIINFYIYEDSSPLVTLRESEKGPERIPGKPPKSNDLAAMSVMWSSTIKPIENGILRSCIPIQFVKHPWGLGHIWLLTKTSMGFVFTARPSSVSLAPTAAPTRQVTVCKKFKVVKVRNIILLRGSSCGQFL